jgi:hypothetical protein
MRRDQLLYGLGSKLFVDDLAWLIAKPYWPCSYRGQVPTSPHRCCPVDIACFIGWRAREYCTVASAFPSLKIWLSFQGTASYFISFNGHICFAEKPYWKILFTDLLREKILCHSSHCAALILFDYCVDKEKVPIFFGLSSSHLSTNLPSSQRVSFSSFSKKMNIFNFNQIYKKILIFRV